MYRPVPLLKRFKYEYDSNDSFSDLSFTENLPQRRRKSGRMTKPSSKLQDYEVGLGKSFDDRRSSDSSFGRERAWSNSSGYSGVSSSSDDPEVIEAAKILLEFREQWREHKYQQGPDMLMNTITTLGTRLHKKRRHVVAPIINPNMRRSFENVKYLSSDPEQAARRRKNTEAARYSRYQSRLREELLEKQLEESEKSNKMTKWRVATKRAYLRGLFSHLDIDDVDLETSNGIENAKITLKQKCLIRGISAD